jgi:hypothetical protein
MVVQYKRRLRGKNPRKEGAYILKNLFEKKIAT